MRQDSHRTTTAVATALGRPADLQAAITVLDALHGAGYAVVRHAAPLADPARDLLAGEIVSGGNRPASEVAGRIIDKLAQAGLAPGAGQPAGPAGRTVPLTIAGVPLIAVISTTEATALCAALAQGRAA